MEKVILVVSFGTSYLNTLEMCIEKAENQIRRAFKDYKVIRAFTSHKIIKKLKEKHEINTDTPEEALEKLYKDGIEEVIIQPLHLIPGEEFNYIRNVQRTFADKFKSLKLGRPIFYYQGIEELPQDYSLFINSVKGLLKLDEGIIMIGHGTANPSNAVYGCLQMVLEDMGYENVFVGTVEGYPNFETVLKRVKRKNINSVMLVPLMLVAGDHAINDMASDDEDSWKTMLEKEGIKVRVHLHGLGEIDSFNNLYIDRINDLIEDRYLGIGETKKGNR
ncbi:sirohydrochlorin cobaltochelatase [Clostridium carnis]